MFEALKDEDLPMEPSDFYKLLTEYTLDDETKIDIRKSRYKKIGKLLEMMSTWKQGEGLIDYSENKQKGHKVITKVFRE